MRNYAEIWKKRLWKELERNFTIEIPQHTMQLDNTNCGVFICWFAYSYINHKSITGNFDPTEFRKFIYETIMATNDLLDIDDDDDDNWGRLYQQ